MAGMTHFLGHSTMTKKLATCGCPRGCVHLLSLNASWRFARVWGLQSISFIPAAMQMKGRLFSIAKQDVLWGLSAMCTGSLFLGIGFDTAGFPQTQRNKSLRFWGVPWSHSRA